MDLHRQGELSFRAFRRTLWRVPDTGENAR